jgi:hypothetical protein
MWTSRISSRRVGSPVVHAAVGLSGNPQEGRAAPVVCSIHPPDDDDADAGGGMHHRPGRWGVERRQDDAAAAQYQMAPCLRSSRVELRGLPTAVRQDRGYDPVNGVDLAPVRNQRPLASPRILGDGAPRVHVPRSSVGAGGHVRHLRRPAFLTPSVTVWHRGVGIASTTRRARRSLLRRGVIVGAGVMRLLNCA